MRIILCFCLTMALMILDAQNSYAARVKVDLDPIDEFIRVSDIYLTQVQAKVQCQFKEAQSGKSVWRERYILTRLDRESDGRYRLRMGKLNLKTWLPEHKLIGCRYKLITLGEDFDGNGLIGEFVLMDLSNMANHNAQEIESSLEKMIIGKMGPQEDAYLGDLQSLK